MFAKLIPGFRLAPVAILGLTMVLAGCESRPPDPAFTSTLSSGSAQKKAAAKGTGYFIDFRSRYAMSYGHTFVVFGKLGSNGRIVSSKVAGLHPAGDDVAPWSLGHIVPVPSETGASDGDTEDQYVTASYRIYLTPAEYQNVSAFIRKLQASSPVWHAVLYNCNAFVADIAHHMGLKTPGTMAMPPDFINGIRSMNDGISRLPSGALSAVASEPSAGD
ncbi:MAG: hypothetical protein LCH61_03005 [Proteobacteria bacterium]|nr:hypothetical protein [Pseudomonadota bacterium]